MMDHIILFSNDDRTEQGLDNVLEFTDGIGYADIVIIATSNPKALDMAIKIAAKNSKINIFAGMTKVASSSSIPLDPNWLHYNQISITGSFSAIPAMLQEAARLASEREIDLSKIITHRYSLDGIQKAMLATEKYYGLRAVINRFS